MPRKSESSNRKGSKERAAAEDEAYARALQEEYRKDFLKRQAKKNKYAQAHRDGQLQQLPPQQAVQASAPPEDLISSPYAIAVPSASPIPAVEDGWYSRHIQTRVEQPEDVEDYYHHTGTGGSAASYSAAANSSPYISSKSVLQDPVEEQSFDIKLAQELQDEEFARRLQNEALRADRNRRSSQRQQHQQPKSFATSLKQSEFMDERTSSGTLSTDDDEAAARRIQQELQDSEYAHRLSILEQQEAMAIHVQRQENARVANSRTRSPRQNCRNRLIPLLICGTAIAIVPLLFVVGVFDTNDVPFLGNVFDNDWNVDPWSGNTTSPQVDGNSFAWANSGNGLTLDILNACDDDWQVFITEALNNWDNGSPIDSLSFRTTRIDYESTCSEVRGKLKICNGNYGNTRWRGLNEVMLSPRQNTIISSTAKLNEYYLARESDAQKLYTACHELGHGFGLPHWDEDFFNKDLGNCMDYTSNPSRNSKPDASNFMYLAQLYGGRNVTATTTTSSSSATEAALPPGKDRRQARALRNQHPRPKSQLLDSVQQIRNRRVLHANEHHEVHLIPSPHYEEDGSMILQQYLLSSDAR